MARRKRHHDNVRQAIARYAPNEHVRDAMTLGALLEGGTLGRGPFNVGDYGHSRGPFQENDQYHKYDHALINDPDYAVNYILPSYVAAAKRVPDSLWNSNPEKAAELTAFYAERPAKDYYATEDVHAKWLSIKGHLPGLQHETFTLADASSPLSTGGMSIGGISVTAILAVVLVVLLIKR